MPDARTRSALLWGVVGALTFLVGLQGYALAVEPLLSLVRGVAVALIVGVVTGASAYALEARVDAWAARRRAER